MSDEKPKRQWTRHPKIQIGDQFHYLTVVAEGPRNGLGPTWWCICKCDRLTILGHPINDANLKRLNSSSCGCWHKERAADSVFIHGESPATGKLPSKTWTCWNNMVQRCTNPNNSEWGNYGGRQPNPVTVCCRWRNYVNFKEDMRQCPGDDWEIDRRDNGCGYWCGKQECEECGRLDREANCRWVPYGENNRNKSGVKRYLFRGVHLTAGQLSELVRGVITADCIADRIDRMGWTVQEALSVVPIERMPRRAPTQ